jgi:arylsulfatase A-like enzyme
MIFGRINFASAIETALDLKPQQSDEKGSSKSPSPFQRVPQTNLLFIMYDDLRPELNAYGKYHVISPNFDRLAKNSVVFDNAYCQVAVCNPSRDSLLTGLRPDTTGTYGFGGVNWRSNSLLVLPTRLMKSGYKTAGFGKIFHWDGNDGDVWNHHYELFGDWYGYQNRERDNMVNSSVWPDKVRPEETFPDHVLASEAIQGLRNLSAANDYFMVSIGFKMPHLSTHVPYKYYDMYRDKLHIWQSSTDEQRQFPRTTPLISHRCCAEPHMRYMNEEGTKRGTEFDDIERVDRPFPLRGYTELMWGYTAMITFVDKQLGRVLDAIDELKLWNNMTIVLTADHGMHNGEKGLW